MDILDRKDLFERLAGEREIILDVVDAFLIHMPAKIEALQQAVIRSDALQIEECGHAVKGAARNVSAIALQEVARQIELAASENSLTKTNGLMNELVSQFTKLQAELEKLAEEL